MPAKIYICYRRDDSGDHVHGIAQYLEGEFGEGSVFVDVMGLHAGANFPEVLERTLSECKVMIVLIGPAWLDVIDDKGLRRLDDPDDWVRLEIRRALQRAIVVIPVNVGNANLPKRAALPEDIRPLLDRQAAVVTARNFRTDMAGLAADINSVLYHGLGRIGVQIGRFGWQIGLIVAALVFLFVSLDYWWPKGAGVSLTLATDKERNPSPPDAQAGSSGTSSSLRGDIVDKLYKEQSQALQLMVNANSSLEKAKAIAAADANLANIDNALKSFPADLYLRVLAGYAAKNVFASTHGTDLLTTEQRLKYLAQARKQFEAVLAIKANDPSALNGLGNVSFYQGDFEAAIKYHSQAIEESGGFYPEAQHDLDLVKRVKSGEAAFDP
jgi:tetratricopeptide (TPR) repeat protein